MERRRFMRALADAAFDGADAVAYPDHPLLLRGPDILGRTESGLVAWFVSTPRSPHAGSPREAARTLLSRLALPAETRFALVLVGSDMPRPGEAELFDEVQIRDANGALVGSAEMSEEAASAAERLRPYHFDRFAEAWAGDRSTARRYRDKKRRGASTWGPQRAQPSRLPQWIERDEEGLVATVRSVRSRSDVLPKVQTLAAVMAATDFDLANGVAGAMETASMLETGDLHLALHALQLDPGDVTASRTTDPFKAYRAAAFAGAEVAYPEEW